MASLALLLMIFAGNVQNQWQPEFEKRKIAFYCNML